MSEQNESSEDRDLPASERKLEKAREQGQVARSRDLSSAAGLGAGLIGLGALGGGLFEACRALLGASLKFDRRLLGDVPAGLDPRLFEWVVTQTSNALFSVLPILLLCGAGGIAGQVALGGIAWTSTPVMPDFSRISPARGLGRIVSKHNLMEFLKLLVIVVTLIAVVAMFIHAYAHELPTLSSMDRAAALVDAISWVKSGAMALLGVLVLAAMIDAPLQWKRHHDQLKMTMQEVKQEGKEQEGDPHVKARIRSRQREMARSRMMAAVPEASVIVTNPTHFAVALRYDENRPGAPKVVAKGVDLLAAKIREVGAAAGVPVLEAPPLARALYAHSKLGMEVPPALYTAVAQVLAYIFQLRMHLEARLPGATAPQLPESLEVPADMDPGIEAELDELDQDIEDAVQQARTEDGVRS